MKFYVRTTKERKLHESYNQINFTELVDVDHKPVESFISQLRKISNDDAVLLEDDLILCENFYEKIYTIIEKYPDRIINFYTNPFYWFETQESDIFSYNQCTYYPKGISEKIAKEMENILHNPNVKLKNQYDCIEHFALKKLNIKHIIYRPCLVQHNDKNSLIQSKNIKIRKTPYFIDYLIKLNISYEQSKELNNLNKIKDLSEYKNI